MTTKRLSREDILNAKDITQEDVEVKEWGGTVLVQALSGKKRAEIMNASMNDRGKMDSSKLYPLLVIAGCVEPKFEKADFESINEKNSGALEKICKVIMRLSGIDTDSVEEVEKNC